MLSQHAAAGLDRLNSLLPLAARQAALTAPLRALHRAVLHRFATAGVPPARDELATLPGMTDMDTALRELAGLDLLVLAPDGITITGAYPFTVEQREHRVRVGSHTVFAMCALDAISIAPMFDVATHVDSVCHVSGDPVTIDMQGRAVIEARPASPMVGIRWQATSGCAAQSLCLEMVFLRDAIVAEDWQQQDSDHISLYTLTDAVAFGAAFFCPLTG